MTLWNTVPSWRGLAAGLIGAAMGFGPTVAGADAVTDRIEAGEPIRIQYVLTNVYPHKILKDAVVHFYVARQDEVGQKALPNLDNEEVIVVETAFDLDFRPGGKAGGRQTLKIDEPGVYLVRVESGNTQSDHEHFAAIDLVIEPAEKP